MAVAYQGQGADVASTTTTLALPAPASNNDDIFIANIYTADNATPTLPQGWTRVVTFTNTVAMEQTVAWYRSAQGDSAATFNFTVAGTTLAYGIITSYRGAQITGNPIRSFSQSANAVSDNVTYASVSPEGITDLIIALGNYGLSATTAGTLGTTDPTFTNRVDLETASGTTASLFAYDGSSVTGVDVGSITHSTTSTVDALNSGVLIQLMAEVGQPDGARGAGAKFAAYSRVRALGPLRDRADPSMPRKHPNGWYW